MANAEIHQALFGYRHGHRILGASRRIDSRTERVLARLTDLSGPQLVQGFETYLTGCPLPDGSYLLARTWYAAEMERPGCVWTHSLLLSPESLSLHHGYHLNKHFRRPDISRGGRVRDAESYEYPIKLESGGRADYPSTSLEIATQVLELLYAHASETVVLAASDSSAFEPSVLQAWDRQWPALKVALRFCTGSLQTRSSANEPFDIEVMPFRSAGELSRAGGPFVFLPNQATAVASILREAIDDSLSSVETPFQALLAVAVEADIADRSSFQKFAAIRSQAFGGSTGVPGASAAATAVAAEFPLASQAGSIKERMFGAWADSMIPFSEADKLGGLLKTEQWRAFDENRLCIRERARSFWRNERAFATELFIDVCDRGSHPMRKAFLAGIADVAAPADACELERRRPGISNVLVLNKPMLASAPDFWSCQRSVSSCLDILDLVVQVNPGDTAVVRSVLTAAYTAPASEGLLQPILARFGGVATETLLDWINTNGIPGQIRLESIQRVLSADPGTVLRWLRAQNTLAQGAAIAGASALDPRCPDFTDVPVDLWFRICDAASELPSDWALPACAFLFGLALNAGGPALAELAARTFQPLHAALAVDRLDYASWLKLREVLPVLGPQHDWDKCERLRQGIVKAFLLHKWPVELFLGLTRSAEVFQGLLESARKIDGSQDILDMVCVGKGESPFLWGATQ
jgi:hypothetical protein